jgi:hypothetical protein
MADKALTPLTYDHSTSAFRRGDTVYFRTSTCADNTYESRRLVDKGTETKMLYVSMVGEYNDTLAAMSTHKAPKKAAKAIVAVRYGRGLRTVETAISSVLRSST